MTAKEIMADLQAHGDEKIKNIFLKHGVKEPMFGVKIEHLKTIQKKVKKDHHLAQELYATGNADAMYLAGLLAEDEKMTKKDLNTWVSQALSQNIAEYTVPWVAAGNPHGYKLALEWIDDKKEHIAAAGWSTLAAWVSLKPDADLDVAGLRTLLARIEKTIQSSPNRVRYTMNSFMICAGAYVTPLTKEVLAVAKKIGPTTVNMEGTACRIPDVAGYIGKIEARGSLGKKKKTVKC
ncbi:DNA alkylation repair protein [Puia sp.]|jgi:3-methyladenine DNA glycosylase AlkD|uniref:DNA alkylation repair protein n=1 Tax=Puia sp. TaxID=2045100 RepID=UPI002F3EEA8C